MRNFRTSKYKKPKYFVNQNQKKWEVIEFPTNDIIRVFKRKVDVKCFQNNLLGIHLLVSENTGGTTIFKE